VSVRSQAAVNAREISDLTKLPGSFRDFGNARWPAMVFDRARRQAIIASNPVMEERSSKHALANDLPA
jgi:hypothetical protein